MALPKPDWQSDDRDSALEQALIVRFGTRGRVPVPFLLRSENGPVFTSRKFTRMVCSYGLRQEFITPHCPQQNGMVERVIRTQLLDLGLVVILYGALGKHRRQVLQCLRLPGRHLVRVHLVVRRNLRYRLLAPNSLQRYSRLKRRRQIPSWLPHESRTSR
jgi:transposase InsO family protein